MIPDIMLISVYRWMWIALDVELWTMNNTIEDNRLETSTYSSKEDIREIFEKMGWEKSK